MPLLNKETAKNYKRRVFEEMQIRGMRLKFVGCMVKFFWFCSAEINAAIGFLRKKSFCLKKIAAWLPWLKSAVLDLGCMNSLGIRKSDIKGPLVCLQPHLHANPIYRVSQKNVLTLRMTRNPLFMNIQ